MSLSPATPDQATPNESPDMSPAEEKDYNKQLKRNFQEIFDSGEMELTSLQRKYFKMRWLDQVLWMEKKASRCRNYYTWLRLTTVIGGVIVPILVSLNSPDQKVLGIRVQDITIGVSGIVAVSSAIEGFFSYGRQWYSYRRSAEALKSEGWQFFQLTGPYKGKNHKEAFTIFADQIEEVIQRDVEVYVTQQAKQQQNNQQQQASEQNGETATPQEKDSSVE